VRARLQAAKASRRLPMPPRQTLRFEERQNSKEEPATGEGRGARMLSLAVSEIILTAIW
jgi:hypothetical protein